MFWSHSSTYTRMKKLYQYLRDENWCWWEKFLLIMVVKYVSGFIWSACVFGMCECVSVVYILCWLGSNLLDRWNGICAWCDYVCGETSES